MWYEIKRASRKPVNFPEIVRGKKYHKSNPKGYKDIPTELIKLSSIKDLEELVTKSNSMIGGLIIDTNPDIDIGFIYIINERKVKISQFLITIYDDYIE